MVKGKANSYIDHNGKERKIPNGKNIRFSLSGHRDLADYCKSKGYNLGAFCEIAAIEKMTTEFRNKTKK